MCFEQYRSPGFWSRFTRDGAYGPWIEELKSLYRAYREKGIPEVTYTKRRLFYETGNRSVMEVPYFEKRTYLAACALLSLLYPESREYIDALHDLVWDACEEYNWILPAHTPSPAARDRYVDLFCTETGSTLSEICWFLEDRIDADVKAVVKACLEEKLFRPFAANTYHWETAPMNWNAVCVCQMASAMLFSDPALFEANLPRFSKAIDIFLSGFPEDGSCLEGVGYWQYGFGRFVFYADMLMKYTKGAVDLLDSPKVRRVAAYPAKCLMKGNTFATFSDVPPLTTINCGLAQYLHRDTGAPMLPAKFQSFGGRWIELVRCFLYADPACEAAAPEREDRYYDKGGQLIINRDRYSLALKAGYNDEPHNHNDIGSFIISGAEGQLICDIGSATYSLQYFRANTRYGFLCNSSEGHSVPIIDGCFQKAGREYAGTLTYEGGSRAEIEAAGAWGLPQLKSLKRVFEWDEDSVTLTDTFEGSVSSVTERFVTLVKPRFENGLLRIGSLTAPLEGCSVTEKSYRPHVGAPEGDDTPVYLIDVPLKPGERRFSVTFTIEDNK